MDRHEIIDRLVSSFIRSDVNKRYELVKPWEENYYVISYDTLEELIEELNNEEYGYEELLEILTANEQNFAKWSLLLDVPEVEIKKMHQLMTQIFPEVGEDLIRTLMVEYLFDDGYENESETIMEEGWGSFNSQNYDLRKHIVSELLSFGS